MRTNRRGLEAIFFDVDGVLINSMSTKGDCLVKAFEELTNRSDEILDFHLRHGGLNRTEKIRRILSEVLDLKSTDRMVSDVSKRFALCLEAKMVSVPLMPHTQDSLFYFSQFVPLFAVSAMPDEELQSLMNDRGLSQFFTQMRGFPPNKGALLEEIMKSYSFNHSHCVLVGDSVNDAKAARKAKCMFVLIKDREDTAQDVEVDSTQVVIRDLSALKAALRDDLSFDVGIKAVR